MNTTSGTLLAATALLAQPLAGAPARAAGGVHLATSIQTLSRTADAVRFAVTVRPAGGPAHRVTLAITTRRPATWTAAVPECLMSRDRTALACDLGDVRAAETRTLRMTARPGPNGPAVVPVVVRAGAANAPSVISSLDGAGPAALRLAKRTSGRPSDDPPPADAAADPSSTASAPVTEPSAGPSSRPSVEPSVEPQADPSAGPPPQVESAAAEPDPSASVGVPAPPRPPSGAGGPKRPPSHAKPAVPHAATHGRPHAAPPAPAALPVPEAPLPAPGALAPGAGAGAPAAPAPGGPLAGPAGPVPGAPVPGTPAPPALPQIAPQAGAPKAAPGRGVSELDTLSPAGAMEEGQRSWTTLVAIGVVTEAGLLWLVAGLTVLRRRRPGENARRTRLRRPVISRSHR
jgi:hypothetical protein